MEQDERAGNHLLLMAWPDNARYRILVLGARKSGKTALLAALGADDVHMDVLAYHGTSYALSEVNMDRVHRYTWTQLRLGADGVVFVLDAAEEEDRRINEGVFLLREILQDATLMSVPVLILHNKIDQRSAKSLEYYEKRIGLDECRQWTPARPVHVAPCSVVRGMQGVREGIAWLFAMLV